VDASTLLKVADRAGPRVELEAGSAPSRRLAGVVLDIEGYAVAGASARAGPVVTQSGEDGSFTLELQGGVSKVVVEAPGFRTVHLDSPRGDLPLRIVLQPVGTIGGAVVGGAHGVVRLAGSGVWPPRQAHTDTLGRFAFDDVPEGVYELDAAGEGWAAPLVTGVRVEGPGGAATADLQALRSVEVSGRVTVAGRPVAAARVTATVGQLALLGADAWSDPSGTYRLRLAPGIYWLRAEAAAFPPAAPTRVEVWPPSTIHHVLLSRGVLLEGQVLTHAGHPAAGARLVVQVERADGPLTLSGASARSRARVTLDRAGAAASGRPDETLRDHRFLADAQGRFTISGIPAGRIRIVASHPASAPTATLPLEVADGERRSHSIVLASPRVLSGRVLDEIGNSLDGARIVLSDPRGILARRVFLAGEGGRFREQGLPPAWHRISISSPGLTPFQKMVDLRRPGEHTLEAHLRRGSITVQGLVSGPDGDPLPGARVSVLAEEPGAEPKVAISDEVGHFQVEGLAPGLFTVQVEHSDHPPATLRGVDGAEPLAVRLGGGGEISGFVTSADGTPVTDAIIIALRRPEAGETSGAFEARRRATEPEGAFRLPGLPPGIYRLTAEAPGFASAHRDGVEVREADQLELNLVLPPKLPVAPPPLE
jgi:hypothetical protein